MITKADGKKSLTMIFNGLAFILAVALPVLSSYGYTGELSPELSVFVVPAITLVNIILRKFFTTQPIA